MLPMIRISILKVKNMLPFGLVLQSIVVIPLPTWFQMLIPLRLSTEVLSGPGLSRILIKGLLSWREEDHQPHSQTLKYPTSSADVDKSTQPDIPTVFIKSRHDEGPTSSKPLPEFNPGDLVGRTFLLPPGANGERIGQK